MNNSAIPQLTLDMPPHHSSSDRHTCSVPRVMGYSALFNVNKDEVFTHMDLPAMDPRDVVPYTTLEYPSQDDVSTSWSFLLSLRYIFTFFRHFLHLLFSLLIHSHAFSVMFYAYSLMIINLSMTNLLSNLILVYYCSNSILPLFSLFLLILWSHTYKDKTNCKCIKGRPQENYPQWGTGEEWVSTRPLISSSLKSWWASASALAASHWRQTPIYPLGTWWVHGGFWNKIPSMGPPGPCWLHFNYFYNLPPIYPPKYPLGTCWVFLQSTHPDTHWSTDWVQLWVCRGFV